MIASWEPYLKKCNQLALRSVEEGNTPFGAVLLDQEGTILLEQGNVELTQHKATGHAETQLAERASQHYSKDFLASCTLVTSVEPCCMCAGAIYWAGIGRVVYGVTERDLLALTGDNDINPTLDLSCRQVFAAGQRAIEVIGPVPEVRDELLEIHRRYWD